MSEHPYVAPPPDGLRLAMAAARGRRFRTAGLSSATLGTALVAVLALLGGTGTQSLVEQPAPEQPAVTRLVPDPAGEHSGRQNVGGAASGGARQGAPQSGQGSVGQVLLRSPADSRAAQPGGGSRAEAKPYAAGAIVRNDNGVYLPQDPSCNVTGKPEDATTLCPAAYVYGPYAPPASPYQLYGEVCSTRTGTTTLHYTGRNEVDMTVVSKTTGDVVWRWSQWHPDDGAAHTLGVVTGGCSSWSYDWTAVDGLGKALAKGDYALTVTFLAAELSGRNRSTYAFTIS